ncbi:MAG: hypothetical protein IH831_09550, partial [Planctomycetes bacterium]|nr:hypothetical protein [Planctomycetota bacterium]
MFSVVGDFDFNGIVDGFDFLQWQRNPSVGSLADWEANYAAVAPPLADTYGGLENASDVVVVTGTAITEKFEVDPAKDRAWDARGTEFLVESVTHGMISLDGDETETGMLWAGGYVESNKPWDASWEDHKIGNPGELTRNSTAIDMKGFDLTVSGLHFFNVHDGPRTNNAFDWQIQHVWGEYVRDDCVESDGWNSGQIVDSLFDGCYT